MQRDLGDVARACVFGGRMGYKYLTAAAAAVSLLYKSSAIEFFTKT